MKIVYVVHLESDVLFKEREGLREEELQDMKEASSRDC